MQSSSAAARDGAPTRFTYYRWRKEFGGLKGNQVKRLKDLGMDYSPCLGLEPGGRYQLPFGSHS